MSNKRKAEAEADAPVADKKAKSDVTTVTTVDEKSSYSDEKNVYSPEVLESLRRTLVEDRESDAKGINWVYTPNQIRDAARLLYDCLNVAPLLALVLSYGDPGLDLVRQMFGGWDLGRVLGVQLTVNGHIVGTEREFAVVKKEEYLHFTLTIRNPALIHKADVLRVYGGDPTRALYRLTKSLPGLPLHRPVPSGTKTRGVLAYANLRRGTVPDDDHTELSMHNWLSTDSFSSIGIMTSTDCLADALATIAYRMEDNDGEIWCNLWRIGAWQAPCF